MATINLWGEIEEPPVPVPPKPVLTYQERLTQQRERAKELARQRKEAGNPLRAKYGAGPEGQTCKGCVHLLKIHYHDQRYLKCDMRRLTHGSASDHRARWLACGKFEAGSGKEYDIDSR